MAKILSNRKSNTEQSSSSSPESHSLSVSIHHHHAVTFEAFPNCRFLASEAKPHQYAWVTTDTMSPCPLAPDETLVGHLNHIES